MAEDGKNAGTAAQSSEIVYDFDCTVCARTRGSFSEAAYFCPRCDDYFCRECLYRSGCDHDHIGRGNVAKWGTPSHFRFDECPRHRGNAIQLYCQADDVVCCAECGQTSHKRCGELTFITSLASTGESEGYMKQASKELKQLHDMVNELHTDKTAKLADLDVAHRRLAADIRNTKARFVAVLDKLEQQSLDQLNEFREELSNKFKSEIQDIDVTKAEMEDLITKLSRLDMNESLIFSRIKRSKEIIKNTKNLVSDMHSSSELEGAEFQAHAQIEEYLSGLQGLGQLMTGIMSESQGKQHAGGSGQSCNQGQGHFNLKLNRPYTVKQKTSFNVKIKEDGYTCNIQGICQLPGGQFVITDHDNMSVKRLDSSYRVVDHCRLDKGPWDVCNTEAGEVAVALKGSVVQFVSVGDTLTTTRAFSTVQQCFSLAYHRQCLYVTTPKDSNMYVYSSSGLLLRTINTDQHGRQLFSQPHYMAICPLANCLYVSDRGRGLVTVDMKGSLLAAFKPAQLDKGSGAVCVDGAGNVFMDSWSNHVLQVGHRGHRLVAQIQAPSDKTVTWANCFDNVHTRLIVSCGSSSNFVTVLHLAQ